MGLSGNEQDNHDFVGAPPQKKGCIHTVDGQNPGINPMNSGVKWNNQLDGLDPSVRTGSFAFRECAALAFFGLW